MLLATGFPFVVPLRSFASYFVRRSGALISREQILQDVWGYDVYSLTHTVDVHVARLRQRLEVDPKRPNLIRTVRRMGYRFETVNQPF